MKRFSAQFALLVTTLAITLFVCVLGQVFYNWFGWTMGYMFQLLWPAVVLSRWGIPAAWVALGLGTTGVLVGLAWTLRKRSLLLAPCVAVILAFGYCAFGRLVLSRLEVSPPLITPYESDNSKRAEYLQTWEYGYRCGVGGVLRTYCFEAEHKTRGFYEGLAQGTRHLDRAFGRNDLSKRDRYTIEAWSRMDGVTLNLANTNGEPPPGTNLAPVAGRR